FLINSPFAVLPAVRACVISGGISTINAGYNSFMLKELVVCFLLFSHIFIYAQSALTEQHSGLCRNE
ncbi:hypothetical protein, partial [Salmonella enterica]|uniref:hypothetical protein n=1 Tax=Salmonella enterica TaxID=28901 RepID=UPI001BB0CC51